MPPPPLDICLHDICPPDIYRHDICPRPLPPPPGHIPPLDICPSAPEKNNKQRLRFNNITSIVIKSIYKDVKDEM